MTRLSEETDILDLAKKMGIESAEDPVVAILDSCRNRIDRWVSEADGIQSVADLEKLVTRKVQMVFEEIRDDGDFDRIKQVYAVGKKEYVFASMRMRFDDPGNPTYGALVRRLKAAPGDPDRYVAVIDCRGEKLARRFFTRWHEIAHRLTTHAYGGDEDPGYRSEHNPIEKLMDRIASHIGFYEPFLESVYDRALQDSGLLCFDAVEAIRTSVFPDASFQSALFACHRRYDRPAIYLEAAPAHKAKHKREINQGRQWLFDDLRPVAELRAVMVVPNEEANRQGFFVPPNMRVPECSMIYRVHSNSVQDRGQSIENLRDWEHSRGQRLADHEVLVEARKFKDRVIGIVQPVATAHRRTEYTECRES